MSRYSSFLGEGRARRIAAITAGALLIGGMAWAQVAGSNANWGGPEAPAAAPTGTPKPKPFTKFQEYGSGTGTFFGGLDCATAESIATLTCPSSHTCHCVHITGPIKGGPAAGTLTLDMNFDLTAAQNTQNFTNGVGSGLCLPGSGIGTIATNTSTLNFKYVGAECDSLGFSTANTLTGYGTAVFVGGTGTFANAAGTSNLAFATAFGTGQPSQFSIQGEYSKSAPLP